MDDILIMLGLIFVGFILVKDFKEFKGHKNDL